MTQPFVTCQLFGQMGNQMFQTAATLSYAWDYNAMAVFPELHKTEDRISYNREKLFFRLDSSMPTRPLKHLFQETSYCSSERPPSFCEDLLLSGYFQSWRHFDHHRDKILKIFAPSEEIEKKLQTKYEALLKHPKTVAIHLRTWLKHLHESKRHSFMGFDYYKEAMEHFDPDSLFVVFSDRINWSKHHLTKRFPQARFYFVEGNDGVEDCFLMSQCKHQIISNSTFSWWAAYLNQNPDKIVIAPKHRVCPSIEPHFPVNDYYPLSWKKLLTQFNDPYPDDMESHGDIFQSLNG